jgi:N-acetylneuraminic acid mutarotase
LSNDGNKYSWNALPSLPAAAASGSGALLNGVLYVTCGWTDQGISNQIWSLDVSQPNTDWLPCQILPGPKRAFPALTACGDYLYLFGGMSPDPNSDPLGVLQDAYRYNPQEDTWLRLKDLPCKGYGWSASPIDKDHVLLTGKADGKISKDIYLIDVRDMTATQIGQTVIQTTTAPLVKVKSDEFWLIAGEPDSNKNRTNRITAIKTN